MKKIKRFLRHISLMQKFELIASGVAIVLFIFGGLIFWAASIPLPNLDSFADRRVTESTKIYDRTGKILLYDVYKNTRRTVIPYDQISANLKNATVAIEDAQFYQNNGIEIKSILRAVLANIFSLGYSQGGSTITQQVVKNSLLTQDKTITRKLKEWVLSVKLAQVMSKEDILSIYLNEVPYGGSLYGAEEASQAYFGKSASDVTLAEAAYLAAMPQAPSYFSPYGSHMKELVDRKNLVLKQMKENNFITEAQYETALAENVSFKPQKDMGIKAPHFVMFIKAYLEKKYGSDVVENGGLKVITSLDYDLQQKAEEIVKRNALENTEKYNASNASMVAIDPKTGQILTMVGSRDYFDTEIDGNFNIATANRQPGSSFKPFVYAAAFNKGYTPDTVVFDLKTQFSTTCAVDNYTSDNGCYSPNNYDDKFLGPVSLRSALAQSRNVPAIQVFYLAGLKDSLNLAKNMGITTLDSNLDRYGLTLVLGGGEVSLLDMTSAYSVFANQGQRNPYTGIVSIEDKKGNMIENFSANPKNVLSSNIASKISSILWDEKAREPEFGSHSALYFPGREVAVKTGTTNDYKDAWIVGYTPSIAVGAWAGNNDNTPMEKKIAGFIVAPMWHEFMNEALKVVPVESFPLPEPEPENTPPVIRGLWEGGRSYFIDTLSGKLATEYTPKETKKEIVIPNVHSILYWINKDDPTKLRTDNPSNDPQFRLWEYAAQKWANQNGYPTVDSNPQIPTSYDDIHVPGKLPSVSISLSNKDSISRNETATVFIETKSYYPITKSEVYINNRYYKSLPGNNTSFSFTPSDISSVDAFNYIRIDVTDSAYNTAEATTTFSVID